jgi:hypothetical protein
MIGVLLVFHAIMGVGVFLNCLRVGSSLASSAKWGAGFLVFGMAALGAWSIAFKRDWGFMYQLQTLVIGVVVEGGLIAGAIFFFGHQHL